MAAPVRAAGSMCAEAIRALLGARLVDRRTAHDAKCVDGGPHARMRTRPDAFCVIERMARARPSVCHVAQEETHMELQKCVSVGEVMRKDVMTLAPDDTIERALEVFEDLRIGGAPVVDVLGQLLGVLTLSDVTQSERLSDGRAGPRTRGFESSDPVGEELVDELDPDEVFFLKEDYSAKLLGRDLVGDWMTRAVVTVTPGTPLDDACRTMVERQIHRVFVQESGKLVGVVSSFDVVRHVARAPEHGKAEPRARRRTRAR